ncbi:MAG: hypothetical protein ACRC8N_01425 [Aeromonas veronii]
MQTLSICDQLRNLRLQNRKMARRGHRYHGNPDLLRSLEYPAANAWRAVWSCINCKGAN